MKSTCFKLALLTLSFSYVSAFAQQIPPQIQGKWGESKKVCAALLSPKSNGENGLTITATNVVIGMDTSCTAQPGSKFDGKEFASAYKCMSEGDVSADSFKLTLLDPGRLEMKSANGSQKYIKCGK